MAYLAVNGNKVLDSSNYKDYCTPNNIGAASTDHTHNYAGSSSAGGVAIIIKTRSDFTVRIRRCIRR